MTQTILEPQVKTCADCPYFQSHDDGTNNGWCNLFDHFAKLTHQQTQDCVNTIRDEEVSTQDELKQQTQELAPEFEIDCDNDPDFGKLYRLWNSYNLCGTFYQDSDGCWIPQPVKSDFRPRVRSELQAQLIIIAVYENPCLQTE